MAPANINAEILVWLDSLEHDTALEENIFLCEMELLQIATMHFCNKPADLAGRGANLWAFPPSAHR